MGSNAKNRAGSVDMNLTKQLSKERTNGHREKEGEKRKKQRDENKERGG
jgi:hypothetical protein